jgi:uncharacterized coiled-coil protein SlyX
MDELTERIVELEIRYTHQASLVEELNVELTSANVVYRKQNPRMSRQSRRKTAITRAFLSFQE